jgi:hypothetical protein
MDYTQAVPKVGPIRIEWYETGKSPCYDTKHTYSSHDFDPHRPLLSLLASGVQEPQPSLCLAEVA